MSEMNRLAQKFLAMRSKPKDADSVEEVKKEMTLHNSFRALFEAQKMSDEEVKSMQLIFSEHMAGQNDEEIVRDDFRNLVQITTEVKSIQKQAVLLIGERIAKVRLILKKYSDEKGAFTKWLKHTFNTLKTAYNALSFYEMYQVLPDEDLKKKFKSMPQKASYILASRQGDFGVKCDIIRDYQGEKQKEVIDLIAEKLPLAEGDRRGRQELGAKTLTEMEHLVDVLDRRIGLIKSSDKDRIEKMILRLRSLVDAFLD